MILAGARRALSVGDDNVRSSKSMRSDLSKEDKERLAIALLESGLVVKGGTAMVSEYGGEYNITSHSIWIIEDAIHGKEARKEDSNKYPQTLTTPSPIP